MGNLDKLTHLDLSHQGLGRRGGFNGNFVKSLSPSASVPLLINPPPPSPSVGCLPGTLPHTITSLTSLVYLDLSYNEFDLDSHADVTEEWLQNVPVVILDGMRDAQRQLPSQY